MISPATNLRRWMALCEASEWIRLYRGETSGNRGGGYYSPDREFARQFTQSGRDAEIITRQIRAADVYVPPEPVRAAASTPALEQLWDETCELARRQGFKAVQFDEGGGEPSIYVLDKSALRRAPITEASAFVSDRLPRSLMQAARAIDQDYGLKISNPMQRAGTDPSAKGFAQHWLDRNTLTVTAIYQQNIPLDPHQLASIPGERNEHQRFEQPESVQRIAKLSASMRRDGFDQTQPVAVRVYPNVTGTRGAAGIRIYEGNHRIQAALAAGIATIPVDWKWCGGSELTSRYHPVLYISA